METKTKTVGKTITDGVGVTETQKEELDYIALRIRDFVDENKISREVSEELRIAGSSIRRAKQFLEESK